MSMDETIKNSCHHEGGKKEVTKYYENNKGRLQEQARNKYRESSNKEKDIKRKYGQNRYKNILKVDKQKLTEYQKIIARQRKYKTYSKKSIIKKIIYFLY